MKKPLTALLITIVFILTFNGASAQYKYPLTGQPILDELVTMLNEVKIRNYDKWMKKQGYKYDSAEKKQEGFTTYHIYTFLKDGHLINLTFDERKYVVAIELFILGHEGVFDEYHTALRNSNYETRNEEFLRTTLSGRRQIRVDWTHIKEPTNYPRYKIDEVEATLTITRTML